MIDLFAFSGALVLLVCIGVFTYSKKDAADKVWIAVGLSVLVLLSCFLIFVVVTAIAMSDSPF
jgi:hypothetical protein